MVITFTDQHDSTDANQCVADIESCGGVVISTSLSQETGILEARVEIENEASFREAFELTDSWVNSDY